MNKDITILGIQAPDLTSVQYGEDINAKFENINANFETLANVEIYKGPAGESVRIDNILVDKSQNDNDIQRQLYIALKSAIDQNIGNNTAALAPVGTTEWDNIIANRHFKVPITVTGDDTYIGSSIPVLFMDARFDSNTIASVEDLDVYEGKIDCTCIVMFKYDNDNQKWVCEINKSFPTLKYERENFYWVLGEETSIIKATGIKGERGDSATVWVCTQDSVNNENEIIVKQYLNNDGQFVPFGENDGVPGDTVIVYESTNDSYNGFFVSTLRERKHDSEYKWIVRVQPDIQNINYVSNIKELFKTINKKHAAGVLNNPPRGMFLLFNPDEQVQAAQNLSHILYVTDNTDTPAAVGSGSYTVGTQLNLTPVKNYEPDENGLFEQTEGNVFDIQYDIITKSINAKADETHSNVLYGVNNPGNDGKLDFGEDVEKNGYPLVICSNDKAGKFENKYMVHGPGDIYCIGKTGSTYVTQELCLQDRIGYFGDVKIGNNLTVGNASNTTGKKKLHVLGDAAIGGRLGVSGNATIDGLLTVNNNATINCETITIGLTSKDDAKMKLYGELYVTHSATIGGNLGVSGNATIGGSLYVAQGATIGGNLGVSGNANVYGSLYVAQGATIGKTLYVAQGATIGGNLGVSGNANVYGSLYVAQGATIGGNLGVSGNATIGRDLGVSGAVTANTLKVTNGATITNGGLSVSKHLLVTSGVTGLVVDTNGVYVGGTMKAQGRVYIEKSIYPTDGLYITDHKPYVDTNGITYDNIYHSMIAHTEYDGVRNGYTGWINKLSIAPRYNDGNTIKPFDYVNGVPDRSDLLCRYYLDIVYGNINAKTDKLIVGDNSKQGRLYCKELNVGFTAAGVTASAITLNGLTGSIECKSLACSGTITGASNKFQVDANGNATVGGNLGVTGAVTIAGSLGVTGSATFTGNVVCGNLNFTQTSSSSVEKDTTDENYMIYKINCKEMCTKYTASASSGDIGKKHCTIKLTNYDEYSIKPTLIEVSGIRSSSAATNRDVVIHLNDRLVCTLNGVFDFSELKAVKVEIQIINSHFLVIVWTNTNHNGAVTCYRAGGKWYSSSV